MFAHHPAFDCSPAAMIALGEGSKVDAEINLLESGAHV